MRGVLNHSLRDFPMIVFNLYFIQQVLGDCLEDSENWEANCNMTKRHALVLMASLVMSCVLFGYKISHLPQLREIWVEKRELNWKRAHIEHTSPTPSKTSGGTAKRRAMPDATEMACIERGKDSALMSGPSSPTTATSNESLHLLRAESTDDPKLLYGLC